MTSDCPVCGNKLRSESSFSDGKQLECYRCGRFALSLEALEDLPQLLKAAQNGRAGLSHALAKITKREPGALIRTSDITHLLAETVLPPVWEQLDNFITWLGEAQGDPGAEADLGLAAEGATGVGTAAGMAFICQHAIDSGLVRDAGLVTLLGGSMVGAVQLTFAGWRHLEELRRGRVASRIAFMAMQFGDDGLDAFYDKFLREAVSQTGFHLKRLDEGQPAGLIDDRLRVEIRQARFLLADLSHRNHGAYWEAGFAEGLGKHVIYTCRKDVFDDPDTRPHFDTNHHLTIIWEPGNEAVAAAKLKDTIRATLPDEAVLTDR